MKRLSLLPALVFLVACGDTATEPDVDQSLITASLDVLDDDEVVDCSIQNNNTVKKLTTCVTLDGVRQHQAAFQAIADANGGTRASGTPGYDASVAYVSSQLIAAGYDVTIQNFSFNAFVQLGPSTVEQLGPAPTTYSEYADYDLMTYTASGDVTGTVTAVDLALGVDNSSTSGCDAGDFVGFPAGDIALVQRGTCTFALKAENAAAAGAVGVIIFNQGNTVGRMGLFNGTLGSEYSGGLPVVSTSYDRGVEWAGTPALVMRLRTDVFNGAVPSSNVLAETPDGDPDNVVMAGGHLDSVLGGPGIQDNGTGSAALLEVALQMAGVKPKNKVRFAWWGAEEAGLIGSSHYVGDLSGPERGDIALYLNFDMIGSPNYVYFVYDGDAAGQASGAIQDLFEGFYSSRGLPFELTGLGGRSDYAAFESYGIPFGGLFTGAEGIKTAAQASVFGGTAGDQYDPCYHLACDTYDNVSLEALDVNSDAVAHSVLQYAMSTASVNGKKGKGNFRGPNSSRVRSNPTGAAVR